MEKVFCNGNYHSEGMGSSEVQIFATTAITVKEGKGAQSMCLGGGERDVGNLHVVADGQHRHSVLDLLVHQQIALGDRGGGQSSWTRG